MATAGVIVDLGGRRAVVGDHVVLLAPAVDGPAGALVVGSVVLRPLRFGERLRVIADVVATRPADAARALGAAVLVAACVRGHLDGAPGTAAIEAIALHLAGARLDERPGFAAAVGLVTRAYGWHAAQVAEADADLVDRLARDVARAFAQAGAPDGGWTSIVLSGGTADPEEIRDRLARDLLDRDRAPFLPSSAGMVDASGPSWTPIRPGGGTPPAAMDEAASVGAFDAVGPSWTVGRPGSETSAAVTRAASVGTFDTAVGPSWTADRPGGEAPAAEDRVVAGRPTRDRAVPGSLSPDPSTVADHIAPSTVADQTHPSTVAHSAVLSTVTDPAAPSTVAGAAVRSTVDDWGSPYHPSPAMPVPPGRPEPVLPFAAATAWSVRTPRHPAPRRTVATVPATDAPVTGTPDGVVELADRLAAHLDDEADLRGVWR